MSGFNVWKAPGVITDGIQQRGESNVRMYTITDFASFGATSAASITAAVYISTLF